MRRSNERALVLVLLRALLLALLRALLGESEADPRGRAHEPGQQQRADKGSQHGAGGREDRP